MLPSKLYLLGFTIKHAGLRLYGAAPSLLERVVPASTTKNGSVSEAFDLLGFALPAGTIVSTQAWSMHRDDSIFPSPDTFLPERWLESNASPEELALMSQHMMPFGTGTRVCGGQNLAQIVMRMVVAAVVRNFDIVAPSETNERTMEMKDSFVSDRAMAVYLLLTAIGPQVIFPASMECKLAFIPRN